jgi:Spy/CpxP family protein refolding chaperone
MIPLAIGLGVLGFVAMRRAHRRCHGHGWGGPWRHGYYHHYDHHRGHGRRWMLNAALERIDATPAQERAIVAEIHKLEERVHAAKAGLRDARGDFAAALRGPVLDDAAIGAVLGRVDTTTAEVRAAGLDAVRAIHAVLDDRQREQLASFVDGGWWRGRGGGGPYRV